jgi:hypothetical protein
METVKVYSPVNDENIQKNLNDSPIWKKAFHEDELAEAIRSNRELFEYSIKFDGLRPVQFTGMKKVEK